MTRGAAVTAGLSTLALILAGCADDDPGGGDSAASDWPSRPITMVIPYVAGGPTDIVGRALAASFADDLGVSVVPLNLPGAGSAVGLNRVATGPTDGYEMIVTGSTGAAIIPSIVDGVEYRNEDFVQLGAVTEYPLVIVTAPGSGIETPEEFMDAARDPERRPVSIASPAIGQTTVDLERMADQKDLDIAGIPFDGNAEAISTMLGGHVDGVIAVASDDVMTQIESGEATPIAVASEERADYLPEVPTLSELGFDITEGTSYYGLAVRADTPPDIVQKLSEALDQALEDPEVRDQIGELYVPDPPIPGDELVDIYAEQQDVYGPAIEDLS